LVPTKDEGQNELAVLSYFSSRELKNQPDNHVVPCIDSFPLPDEKSSHFIVMPLFGRYREPPFKTLAEIHDFLQQIFKATRLYFIFRESN
jgi:hypothetical protein